MKPVKLSQLLFSLAVISALVMAAIPTAPAYALSAYASASDQTSISAAGADAPANAVVCKSVVKWRDGHRILVRVCRRVPPHEPNSGS
jgi:hypothetical protein